MSATPLRDDEWQDVAAILATEAASAEAQYDATKELGDLARSRRLLRYALAISEGARPPRQVQAPQHTVEGSR